MDVIVLYLEYSCTFLYAFVCKFKNIRLLVHARFHLIKEEKLYELSGIEEQAEGKQFRYNMQIAPRNAVHLYSRGAWFECRPA